MQPAIQMPCTYLAGLIADESKMIMQNLPAWVKQAASVNIIEYTVPWIAAESRFSYELALKWIDAKQATVAAAGWFTLASLVAINPDDALDIPALKKLMSRVQNEIHKAEERVRHNMNGFVIAAGCYVTALTAYAISIADKTKTRTDGQPYKIADATDYIIKSTGYGKLRKKEKNGKVLKSYRVKQT